MNYLTDKHGKDIDQWNPLSVNDVSVSYDKVAVTGETVTFVTGAAGFSQSVSLDKAPVMSLLGDRVGSFYREPRNLRCYNNYRMPSAKVTALVETATSATVTITDPDFNLEQLFESPAATAIGVIVVRDSSGGELRGFIGAVAASGNSYVLDIYNSAALSTQSWLGTLASFTLDAGSTQYEIYENTSSISWTTGTVLTTEVKFPDAAANDPVALNEFIGGLSNGEYGIDYERGNLHYKKATTGTSDTIAYTTRAATTVVVTSAGGTSTLVDDAAFTAGTSLVTPIGYVADETATDSVDEGDIGAPRMTLTRKAIGASDFLEDSVFASGGYLSMFGQEIDDPNALAAMTEGDVGNGKGDLQGRQIVRAGTLLSENDTPTAMAGASASVTGVNTLLDLTADETVAALKTIPGNLYGFEFQNPSGSDEWVQLFDLATGSVTLGTTVPKLSFIIPAGGENTVYLPVPIQFSTAITYAVTSTASGAGASSGTAILNFLYR